VNAIDGTIEKITARLRAAGVRDGMTIRVLEPTDHTLFVDVFYRWRRWRIWEHSRSFDLFALGSMRDAEHHVVESTTQMALGIHAAIRRDCAMVRAGVCALWETSAEAEGA